MRDLAELELQLRRWSPSRYQADLRFSPPKSDNEIQMIRHGPALVQLDLTALQKLVDAPDAYGHRLTELLFAETALRDGLATARASAGQTPLRLRVFIDSSAPELHAVRWETLRDPVGGAPLGMEDRVYLSRYLTSTDMQPVAPCAKDELRVLVAVAQPTDIDQYPVGDRRLEIDPSVDAGLATQALVGMRVTELAQPVSLARIREQLETGFDVFYLVCHGQLTDQPWLWLQNEADGRTAQVAGEELVSAIRGLGERPMLVVLASCQSAGSGEDRTSADRGALAALGPQLAEAGVAAVVAMQDDVTLKTVRSFVPAFLAGLRQHGQIDRAVGSARRAVGDRPDAWVPVLYMRLKSGVIWYGAETGAGARTFARWPALFASLDDGGRCTPILGSGVTESLVGSSRAIARSWAELYHFPMAKDDEEDLALVAHHVAAAQSRHTLYLGRETYLRQEVLRRFSANVGDDLRKKGLDELLEWANSRPRPAGVVDPHAVLAQLPCPVFLTANGDTLLEEALKRTPSAAAGGQTKRPRSEWCRWYDTRMSEAPPLDGDPRYHPSADEPLVYHLFGCNSRRESLVLTVDDYLDYLIRITMHPNLVPKEVSASLTQSAVLCVGLQLDDWPFRILFRWLQALEGRRWRSENQEGLVDVAVQIDPEEGRIVDQEGAREYLESYFQKSQMFIYWGKAEKFALQLQERWLAHLASRAT